MIRKGMKLYSILFGACPKCHKESMYFEKNPYKITTVLKINDHCSHCKTKYRMEPSFFYGNIWINLFMSYDKQIAKNATLKDI